MIIDDELLSKLKNNQYLKKLCRSMFEAGYNFKKLTDDCEMTDKT